METAVALLREVAEESPIKANDWVNLCKFCNTSWAERDYNEYLKNCELLKVNPKARQEGCGHPVSWEHHEPDCLWVRANEALVAD